MKLVQIAIFASVVIWAIGQEGAHFRNGLAVGVLAALVTFVFTVVPWLIFMGWRDIFGAIRNRRSKIIRRRDPVFAEMLGHRVARLTRSYRRPRIGN